VVARYEDTGRFDVPDYQRWPQQAPPYGPPPPPPPPPAEAIAGFSRDTWVRMVIWILPLVFIAGTLYFNLQSSMARQDAMDAQVRALSDRVAGLASDQRVLQEHVQALRLNGDRIQPQLDGLKDQLNELRLDLGAIREKLGIVPKPRTN
jgi:outer membrane murein-binding lipoprotein Lpp